MKYETLSSIQLIAIPVVSLFILLGMTGSANTESGHAMRLAQAETEPGAGHESRRLSKDMGVTNERRRDPGTHRVTTERNSSRRVERRGHRTNRRVRETARTVEPLETPPRSPHLRRQEELRRRKVQTIGEDDEHTRRRIDPGSRRIGAVEPTPKVNTTRDPEVGAGLEETDRPVERPAREEGIGTDPGQEVEAGPDANERRFDAPAYEDVIETDTGQEAGAGPDPSERALDITQDNAGFDQTERQEPESGARLRRPGIDPGAGQEAGAGPDPSERELGIALKERAATEGEPKDN